ncbi:hypothetical protein UFOVP63_34 [uncultured Caudovirales phage]|uniref:Uncharacterized protein n=1 Tax=uncultured Caudovirales phage TaxID=2100421 RepID=A0A6J5KUM2_9CAUD|nr:hypothetical protein UFOVP63_34 [uncultured Caudovirales phage]
MYKLYISTITGEINSVIQLEDNKVIPMDNGNKDYQKYLKWISEGNEPIPADKPDTQA